MQRRLQRHRRTRFIKPAPQLVGGDDLAPEERSLQEDRREPAILGVCGAFWRVLTRSRSGSRSHPSPEVAETLRNSLTASTLVGAVVGALEHPEGENRLLAYHTDDVRATRTPALGARCPACLGIF